MSNSPSSHPVWICQTCAVEYAVSDQPPDSCPICSDERQYLMPDGIQRWTTMPDLVRDHHIEMNESEPGLWELWAEPKVGIGQRSFLVISSQGNLLWDPLGILTDDAVARIGALGGIRWIASSHPHMFGAQVAWSEAFGDAPIYVNRHDASWIGRQSDVIEFWDDDLNLASGLDLYRFGGHFPGSSAALWEGNDQAGVLLSSDTISPAAARGWVKFMRSYPNEIPLSPAVVDRLRDRALSLTFDRLYGNFRWQDVKQDAHDVIVKSASRQNAWVRGDFDHLT